MKKKLKISYNAPVVLTFVLICLFVLMIGFITGGNSTALLFMTYRSGLANPLTYVRLFTHIFGHSGWEHFLGNSAYLLLLGPMLEEKYGSRLLIEIIAITAVITGLVNNLLFAQTALCGASGIVFAFIILASFTGFKEGEIPLTFILVSLIYIGQQIFQGLTLTDNISNMAHIVGGATGAVLGYILNKNSAKK
ncbi:MAG: rhomboid family intramembrane serine protease [Butyrivibrio sp.]|nr:rhomboid family intramembrane serine protease [Butyrivibrio sp.]